ncbi:LLM class flavin-dependent oxidoreductase [uncultured Amnibacterium sp.]|uniref:LLM class flavin-dependent oxidoreductase n=1 Tax=uncultured Amnibacterium sp. TaxID=1631851 RepID=UPI0035CC0D7A
MSLDLGFLVFLDHRRPDGARQALRDGIRLFEHAERLGYDSGWVRVHHGAADLTAPFPFLAAAAQHTSRIRLGTAVIPIGYEDPVRWVENAATTDLLADGRLELGLSSGVPALDDLGPAERRVLVEQKLTGVLDAFDAAERRAAELSAPEEGAPAPNGPVTAFRGDIASPVSPGLVHRLWYGAGSTASAIRAAERGLHLVLSTIHGERTGPTLGHTQASLIRAYRDAFAEHHPERTPRVAIGRSILPIVDAADRERFGGFKDFYDRLVTADGRYTDGSGFAGQASPLHSGEPAAIIDALLEDPSLELADELVLTPISELDLAAKKHVFASVAEHVAEPLRRHAAQRAIPA